MTNDANRGKASNPKESPLEETRQVHWEEDFYRQIVSYLGKPEEAFFCRLNFLCTDQGKVYFINIKGWWHSVCGDTFNILQRLQRKDGQLVEIVEAKNSSRGWIPYFARSREEERGVGWHDKKLVVVSENKNLQRRVRRTQKSYHGWVPQNCWPKGE